MRNAETKRKSARGGAQPSRVSARPKPELTDAQLLVLDEVADIILHASRDRDLDNLLSATLGNAMHRIYSTTKVDSDKVAAEEIPKFRASIMATREKYDFKPVSSQPRPRQYHRSHSGGCDQRTTFRA